jgi:hypothetical protein
MTLPKHVFSHFGKILLAFGIGLFLFDLLAWRATNVWNPLTLAATLSAFHIVIRAPWPWLLSLYTFLGLRTLATLFSATGLTLIVAFGKAPGETWSQFLGSLITLPMTLVMLLWTDTVRTLRFLFVSFLLFLVAVVTVPALWFWYDYSTSAHRWGYSAKCDVEKVVFGNLELPFIYGCVDVSQEHSESDKRYFAFFMASGEYPAPDANDTGHAWFAQLALKKGGDTFVATDYDVIGYGYRPGSASCQAWLQNFYSYIRPLVPKAIDTLLTVWYCRAPVIAPEGPSFHDDAGKPFPAHPSAADVINFLGHAPVVLMAVAVNETQFNNLRLTVDAQLKDTRPYQLLYHDCTTFVRELADLIGLYNPPRILVPFPSDAVRGLLKYNPYFDQVPQTLK